MEAGYRIWSHVEEFERGRVRLWTDVGSGNVMVFAGGMVWNSADGMWKICGESRIEDGVWIDGIGGRHEVFVDEGRVMRDGCGNWLRFSADGKAENGVVDGKCVEFAYTGGILTAVEGCDGRRVFGYCGDKVAVAGGMETAIFEYEGDLVSRVRFADGDEAGFLYEDGRMAGVCSGGEVLRIGYDEMGRCAEVGKCSVLYGDGERIVRRNGEWRYFFDGEGRCVRAEHGGEEWKFNCAGKGCIGDYLWV